jgi:lipopolysaccharide/colanic/teichoic acid biosynthesis glycosyltransferase
VYFANEFVESPTWEKLAKRAIDVLCSTLGLLLLSPLLVYIAFRVSISSRGPVIYSQERVGYMGRKFMMHKFRSMFEDAETNGPRLASKHDKRVTPWGTVMRRWKLDELPQLWNVLTGDMSLVGPRPEREFFIRQLEANNQPFLHLLQVKPGLTSLGITKFGYAGDLKQLEQRLQYDLAYIEKRSLSLDLKIMVDTIRVIFADKGK